MTPDDPTPPPPSSWLYQELLALRTEHRESHQRLRADMTAGFDQIRYDLITKQTARLDDYAARLLVIETERDVEAKHLATVGTWAGLLAASAMTAAIKLIELVWRK